MRIQIDKAFHDKICRLMRLPDYADYAKMSISDFIYELFCQAYISYTKDNISIPFKKLKTKQILKEKVSQAQETLSYLEKKINNGEKTNDSNPNSEDNYYAHKHLLSEKAKELKQFKYYTYELPIDNEATQIMNKLKKEGNYRKNPANALTDNDIIYSLIRHAFNSQFKESLERHEWNTIVQKYPTHILALNNITYQKNTDIIRFAHVAYAIDVSSSTLNSVSNLSDMRFILGNSICIKTTYPNNIYDVDYKILNDNGTTVLSCLKIKILTPVTSNTATAPITPNSTSYPNIKAAAYRNYLHNK